MVREVTHKVSATPNEIAELERIAALGWQGLEQQRLGDWLLRAANGFTGRANSLLPLGLPDRPTSAALATVVEWYERRGLRPLVQVPLPLCEELDAVLAARGWRAFNPTSVLAGAVDALVAATPPRPDLPAARESSRPSAAWLAGYRYRGSVLPAVAEQVLSRATAPVFVTVEENQEVLAVGRGVVDEGWLGVTAVTVHEAHRRRGLGTYVMRSLALWGAHRSARSVYLQVARDNTPAVRMYRQLGIAEHHHYHYRTLDPRPPGR